MKMNNDDMLLELKNAIEITVKKAPENYDLGTSKFFGAPTIPNKWVDDFYEDEVFFCQIRLSDIADLDKENKLPHTGYLYIFMDISGFPYEPRILYYDGEPDTVIDDFNLEVPYAEHLNDAWLMNFELIEDDASGIKLFGIPADWCYEEQPPKLLMQFDPLASSMGFRDSMDGYLYFFFSETSTNLEDVMYREEYS